MSGREEKELEERYVQEKRDLEKKFRNTVESSALLNHKEEDLTKLNAVIKEVSDEIKHLISEIGKTDNAILNTANLIVSWKGENHSDYNFIESDLSSNPVMELVTFRIAEIEKNFECIKFYYNSRHNLEKKKIAILDKKIALENLFLKELNQIDKSLSKLLLNCITNEIGNDELFVQYFIDALDYHKREISRVNNVDQINLEKSKNYLKSKDELIHNLNLTFAALVSGIKYNPVFNGYFGNEYFDDILKNFMGEAELKVILKKENNFNAIKNRYVK